MMVRVLSTLLVNGRAVVAGEIVDLDGERARTLAAEGIVRWLTPDEEGAEVEHRAKARREAEIELAVGPAVAAARLRADAMVRAAVEAAKQRARTEIEAARIAAEAEVNAARQRAEDEARRG